MSILRGFRFSAAHERASGSAEDHSGPDEVARSGDLGFGDPVGEYRIVQKLGEGGFGTVYEAAHPVIGKRAAVKVLHAQYSADEAVTARFIAEARAVNQIRDRNIIDIFSFGDLPDGRHYYVMELLEGVPLDAYLERAGRVPVEEALPILQVVARAISAAHQAGIAHRDLKPGNVFLELDDEGCVYPKILDFGVAKLLGSGSLTIHKTRSGTPIGSPRYMSPEQCKGVQVDHRTDVYAFGCIAYRMLAGVPVFDAASALELMMAHVSAPPTAPSNRCPELGPKYDEPILRMLSKDPDERPQSMQEAYELLAQAAERAEQAARDTKIPVSPLLRDMVRDREREPSASVDLSRLRRPSRSEYGSRGSAWGWRLALGAVLMAGVAWLIVARSPDPAVPPMPTAARIVDKPPASKPQTSEVRAPPLPSTVAVTVRSRPAHAEIHHNGQKLGTAPGPVSIPRGDRTETLVIKAPGYKPARLVVHPTDDLTAEVTLVTQARRPVRRAVPRDLENPY